jgi:trigger factor
LTSPPADEENKARVDINTPLLGLSAGENKTFTINYPDDWQQSRYAGKEITYEVAVSSVKTKEIDSLDDEFAKSVGDVETLAELKDRLRTNIQNRRQAEADHALGQQSLEKIIADAEKIEWAEGLEEYRLDGELEDYAERVKQAGLTLDSYLQMQNMTKDELREKFRPNVVNALKTGLMLGKLAELEGLEVSQMEVLERARAIAYMSGGDDRIWQNILSSPSRQAFVANNVLSDKVIERLAAIANQPPRRLPSQPTPPDD